MTLSKPQCPDCGADITPGYADGLHTCSAAPKPQRPEGAKNTIGRGGHLLVCDDPVDPEKARSALYQAKFQRWWPAKWLSRQEPGCRLVLVMQRLGIADPIDYLFRREVGENTPKAEEGWHVLVMDEVKSDEPLGKWGGPMGLPPGCKIITDSRKIGAVLSPTRFSEIEVKRAQRTAGPLDTATQRQQRPMRPTGDFWRKKWFTPYDTLPPDAYNKGRDWDTAYTKNEVNSASAYVESYRGVGDDDSFPVYIEGVSWDWLEFPDLVKWMQALGGPHYVEQKASGKSVVQTLKVYGVVSEEVAVHGDKFARAAAAQPAVSCGRVFVNRMLYDSLLFGEGQGLLRITAEALQAEHGGLDLNDAFVQALHRHLGLSDLTKKKKVAVFA